MFVLRMSQEQQTGWWRVFIRDEKTGFFKEAFQNYRTREEVEKVIHQAKKERKDIKVLDTQNSNWTMETVQ